MNLYYVIAAVLIFLTGAAHSYLGEKHFLKRLLRHDFPPELEIDAHINRTTRVAWHQTTLSWWGIAIILLAIAFYPETETIPLIGFLIALGYVISGIYSLVGSRGRHVLGLVQILVSLIIFWGSI